MFPKQATALALTGLQVHRTYEAGTRGYDTVPRPGTHRDLLVVTMGSIGVSAYNAGRQVWIVDIGGLAEPLAARTSVISGRAAGHRKSVDLAWYDAEFGARARRLERGRGAARALMPTHFRSAPRDQRSAHPVTLRP